jgi:hypothetical protein
MNLVHLVDEIQTKTLHFFSSFILKEDMKKSSNLTKRKRKKQNTSGENYSNKKLVKNCVIYGSAL